MLKNFVRALVMSGIVAVSPGDPDRGGGRRGPGLRLPAGSRIVGSWMGTTRERRYRSSCRSTSMALPLARSKAKSPMRQRLSHRGTWRLDSCRRPAVRGNRHRCSIRPPDGWRTGKCQLRLLLTVNRSGDQMTAYVVLDVFAPDGTPVGSFPHTVTFTRIKVEPADDGVEDSRR